MAELEKLLKEKADTITRDPGKMKVVGQWLKAGYKGKVIGFAAPDKSYHVVIKKDGVTVRPGDYPSSEARYSGSEKDLIAVLNSEINAYLGARTGRVVVWGNLNDATVFERLL
ncbi:MAG: SCP2 sterol-binding domain-containing protein [Chloroflexi bacterium]|nr:SCP2 sterol-binding domain-containing protein [Chloroflexota bacterium]